MSGKVRRTRSTRQVRVLVSELPAEASSVHIRATPMPCHATEIITMSIPAFAGTALPKSQLVRSIASTHSLPSSPRRSATIRAEPAPSSARTGRTGRSAAAPKRSPPRCPHTQPAATGRSCPVAPDRLPAINRINCPKSPECAVETASLKLGGFGVHSANCRHRIVQSHLLMHFGALSNSDSPISHAGAT